jgi:hypothetical protein
MVAVDVFESSIKLFISLFALLTQLLGLDTIEMQSGRPIVEAELDD